MKHDITLPLAKAFIRRAAALSYEVRMANAGQDPKLCLDAYFGKNPVCQFEMTGAMRFYRDNPLIAERNELHDLLLTMKQAHDLYADAPPFPPVESKGFRLISAFGDAVLAARMGVDDEVRFVTWQYTYDRTSVTMGHYYETNYEGAKQDFAVRAGLLDKNQLFTEDELVALHDACVFRGRNDDEISFDDEHKLHEVMDKVAGNIPNLIFDHESEPEQGMEV